MFPGGEVNWSECDNPERSSGIRMCTRQCSSFSFSLSIHHHHPSKRCIRSYLSFVCSLICSKFYIDVQCHLLKPLKLVHCNAIAIDRHSWKQRSILMKTWSLKNYLTVHRCTKRFQPTTIKKSISLSFLYAQYFTNCSLSTQWLPAPAKHKKKT